jgi:hypothetical protein
MSWLPRSSSVPLQRRWVSDIMHFGKKSHCVGCKWVINVAPTAAARKSRNPPVSWVAIWVRTIALAGQKWPELRMCYLPYPWPRMYLHPFTVATFVVERQWNGVPAVFFDTLKNPETLSITAIEQNFRGLREFPVESIGAFRRLIRISKLPFLLRRCLWSIGFYWSGRLRTKYLGSFSVNFIRAPRFSVAQTVTPISFSLWFSLVDPNGDMTAHLLWDHRLLDAMTADLLVHDLEAIMNGAVAAELRAL